MIVYYGTYTNIEKIDLSMLLDKGGFGVGSYTANDIEQAERGALNRHEKRILDSLVLTYETERYVVNEKGLKFEIFANTGDTYYE